MDVEDQMTEDGFEVQWLQAAHAFNAAACYYWPGHMPIFGVCYP